LNRNFFRLALVGRIMLPSVVPSVNVGRRVDVTMEAAEEEMEVDELTEVNTWGKLCWAGVCCCGAGVVTAVVGVVTPVMGGAEVVLAVLRSRLAITFLAGFLVSNDFIRCRRTSGLVLE
jgi:flagellar motor component MotA